VQPGTSRWAEIVALARRQPYRVLFWVGTACAVLGLAVWITFAAMPELGYPGRSHATLLMQGFLLSFVLGFLFTMLPRALGVALPGASTLGITVGAILALGAAALTGHHVVAAAAHAVALGTFILFAARRAFRLPERPPEPFVHIAVAFTSTFVAAIASIITECGVGPGWVGGLCRSLAGEGFVLMLVVGVGSFLVPKLTSPASGCDGPAPARASLPLEALLAALMLTSYLVQWLPLIPDGEVRIRLGYGLRAAVFASFLVRHVLPRRMPPESPPYLAGLRWSLILTGVGLGLAAVLPRWVLAWQHMAYIGGLTWLTLTVASRVAIGHAPEVAQPGWRRVAAIAILLLLAMLVRVAAGIWPAAYVLHLAIAAGIAVAAFALWATLLFPRCRLLP